MSIFIMKLSKLFYIDGKAKLTYIIIGITSFIFLIEVLANQTYGVNYLENVFNDYGFSLGNLLQGRFWVFVTSIFLHAGPEHLILNMVALFFFGKVVEANLGWKKYLIIFFVAAFVGDLGIVLMDLLGLGSSVVATIGMSGAIFGLLGTAMLIKPFDLVFYPYLIPVPLIMVALLYTLFNVSAFILVLSGGYVTDVSYMAHIGGLASGMVFGFKEEGRKKGLMLLLLLMILLLAVPLFYFIFQVLEGANYVTLISQTFK